MSRNLCRVIGSLVVAWMAVVSSSGAQAAVLSMPDNAQGNPGAIVQVPITVTPGDGIFGIEMTVQYNPAVLQAQDVTVSGIASTAGFSLVKNLNNPGQAIIVMFAPGGPLVGSGEIARIHFQVVGAGGTTSPLTFTSAVINEGHIPASLDNGLFTVPAPGALLSMPDNAQGSPGAVVQVPISVTPGDNIFGIEMTVQYDPAVITAQDVTVSGIASTAGFSLVRNLSNPGSIVIVMFAPGGPLVGSGVIAQIQFHVVGAQGTMSPLTFTSASINENQIPASFDNGLFSVPTVGAVLSMPDTANGGTGAVVQVPISVTPGDGILGVDMTINYNSAVLTAQNVTVTGIGSAAGFAVVRNLNNPGVIVITTYATGDPMSGSGPFLLIQFLVVGNPGTTSNLTFASASINEGSIPAIIDNGLFTVTCAGAANGTGCNDGDNVCTPVDTCQGGVCVGTPLNCNDSNPCTVDSCTAGVGCQNTPGNAGTVCRASAGECDLAESCTGTASACPADALRPSGTSCTSDGNACTADQCNGVSTSCQHPAGNSGAVCRASAGACDVAETCSGAATTCPTDGFAPSGTACGDGSDTVCDNPDTCNATGSCQVNNEPGTVTCRADAGACDVAELCNGAGVCPADGFESAGTACGDGSDTVCDNPDTCNATGSCQVNNEPGTVTCRADAGACDVAELCNGAGVCPADGFESAGTACGDGSDTVCDNPDTCNATGSCQVNNEPGTVTCRADAGACDVAELCNGAGVCPADGFESAGTACGDGSDTVCDNPDTCNATGSCQVNNEPGTVTCRADAGACDVAELCNGAGVCPADGFESAGTACGDGSDTVCDNPDTCNATGSCQVNNEPGTVTCRADAGACDVAELCNGAGVCPADGFESAGTACGDGSDTVCDNPDTCNATGSCQVNNEPGTVTCRADAGACDVAELCNGAGVCPADGFESAGTACGDGSDTVCDNPDTCNATGSCQVNNEPGTVTCRADAGACDVAELCNGAGVCPADGFESAGTACGDGSDTVCDNPDTCNATGSCQVNNEPGTVTCRADAGACDVAELCNGAGVCPADGFESAGTACGDGSDTVCDNPDTCNATGSCQVNNEPGTVTCRADAGACDVAELCNGAGVCPADGFESAGTACGDGSDTVCDNPDTCNATGSCQVNNEPGTVTCRADAGACDVAELCNGAGACPADGFESAGTSCGSNSNTVCDNADTCNATGSCQVNNEPGTVTCRADAGACDVAEQCDGAGACPADGFESAGTSCGSNADTVCDNPDTCNATGSCQVNNEPATVTCRAEAGACDVAELCDGAGVCPADLVRPDGTSCNDNDATTCTDECTAGDCAGTPVPEPLAIDGSLRVDKDAGGMTEVTWGDAPGPYNVYRGSNGAGAPWEYNQSCLVHETTATTVNDPANPPPETLFYYLVSRVNACRESILGTDSAGTPIPNNDPCP